MLAKFVVSGFINGVDQISMGFKYIYIDIKGLNQPIARVWVVDEALIGGSRKLSKAAVAMGGFLIFVGVLMIGVFALAIFDIIDVGMFMSNEHRVLFVSVLLMVSVLDLVSGIMLARG